MDQNIFESDEKVFYLNNIKNNENKCEFEQEFKKTLQLNEPHECALMEINLPNQMSTHKFYKTRYITLWLYWNKFLRIEVGRTLIPPGGDYHQRFHLLPTPYRDHFRRSIDKRKIKLKKYSIGPNLETLEEIELRLRQINSFARTEMILAYKNIFVDAILEDDLNLFPPNISFHNNHVKNEYGRIQYRGHHLEKNEEHNLVNFNKHKEIYEKDKKKFFRYTACFVYYEIDKDLAQLFGYETSHIPQHIFEESHDETKITQINGGLSTFEVNFEWFDLIYIYCDIITESHCGDIKANVLKVFPRKRANQNHQMVTYAFTNLMFIPLRIDEIHKIKISCADSSGQIPKYKVGHVSLTLLIRKLKNI